MEFYETTNGRLGMRGITPVLVELLKLIPAAGERDSDAIEQRFFPPPSDEAGEESLREDWKALVEPELLSVFQDARQVVESDLRALEEEDGMFTLEFSLVHAEAWMNALNQARIALAERHGIGEREIGGPYPEQIRSEHDLALLQMYLYEHILHWLVEVLDS